MFVPVPVVQGCLAPTVTFCASACPQERLREGDGEARSVPHSGVSVRERGRLVLEGALPLQGRRLLLRREEVSDEMTKAAGGQIEHIYAETNRKLSQRCTAPSWR